MRIIKNIVGRVLELENMGRSKPQVNMNAYRTAKNLKRAGLSIPEIMTHIEQAYSPRGKWESKHRGLERLSIYYLSNKIDPSKVRKELSQIIANGGDYWAASRDLNNSF